MASERDPIVLNWDFNPGSYDSEESSFETMLDTACERLREKHIEYSIRRIKLLGEELEIMEKELDDIIGSS